MGEKIDPVDPRDSSWNPAKWLRDFFNTDGVNDTNWRGGLRRQKIDDEIGPSKTDGGTYRFGDDAGINTRITNLSRKMEDLENEIKTTNNPIERKRLQNELDVARHKRAELKEQRRGN